MSIRQYRKSQEKPTGKDGVESRIAPQSADELLEAIQSGRLDKRTGMGPEALQTSLHDLLTQCRQWQRPAAGQPAVPHPHHPINPDGALLVRFLAQRGLDEERA